MEKKVISIIMLIMLCMSVMMTSCGQLDDADKKGADENAAKIEKQIEKEESADKDKNDKVKSSTEADDKSSGKKNAAQSDKTVSGSSGSGSGSSVDNTSSVTTAAKVCYISIDGYCSSKAISIQGGDTAYSILTRSGARVSGSGSYVKGINGLYEFDKGPQSGWKYSVNGYTPNVGAGSYSVKAGDSIRWYYVTSY